MPKEPRQIAGHSLHEEFWDHIEAEEFDEAAAVMLPMPRKVTPDLAQTLVELRSVYSTIFETIILDLGSPQDRTEILAVDGNMHWLRYKLNLDVDEHAEADDDFDRAQFSVNYANYGSGAVESGASTRRVRSVAFGIRMDTEDSFSRIAELNRKIALVIERARKD